MRLLHRRIAAGLVVDNLRRTVIQNVDTIGPPGERYSATPDLDWESSDLRVTRTNPVRPCPFPIQNTMYRALVARPPHGVNVRRQLRFRERLSPSFQKFLQGIRRHRISARPGERVQRRVEQRSAFGRAWIADQRFQSL